MERYEIATFLALAEELHFTRTAERLLVPPGRVSQTIKKLERRASAACRGLGGVVRVGFTTAWSGDLIVRAAERFGSRHPRCSIELRDVTYSAALAALQGEDVDLLIAEPPVEDPAIAVGPVLFSETRALLVPSDHPLAARESASLEDLAVLPLITAAGVSPAWHDAFFPRRTPQGRPVRHGVAAAGWQEILSLVGAGQGATVSTVRAAHYYGRPDITFVPFDDAPPVEGALMWRKSDHSAGLQAFIETLVGLDDTR
ncbi:LysR family transcriptional regulator [Streptomyces sp. NPDC050738]|uniref:LysR family transcriptional regulator n=1 Tax=Streptomyces sp. NPDC050738 TaxID=3154744 RepID=UPI00342B8F1E